MTTEREKMLAGQLYDPSDVELKTARIIAREKMEDFNKETDRDKRKEIIKKLVWYNRC